MKLAIVLTTLAALGATATPLVSQIDKTNATEISIEDDGISTGGAAKCDLGRCNRLYWSCKGWCEFNCWRTCCNYAWSQNRECQKCASYMKPTCSGADNPKTKPPPGQ